jgi:hypothetical protein
MNVLQHVHVCVCVWVCVWERERERERWYEWVADELSQTCAAGIKLERSKSFRCLTILTQFSGLLCWMFFSVKMTKFAKRLKNLFMLWMSVTVKQRMNGRVIISDNFQFQIQSTFNFNWYIFFPRTFWVKVSFLFKIPQIPAPTFFIILLQNKETFKSVIHQS